MELKGYKCEIIVTQSLKDYFSSYRVSTIVFSGKKKKERKKDSLGSESKIISPPTF